MKMTKKVHFVWMRENNLYTKVICWGIREDVTWENICNRTAVSILAHVNPKTLDELRRLTRVMDESMMETYGERVLELLQMDS